MVSDPPNPFVDQPDVLARAQLLALLYRLGCQKASGVLTICFSASESREVFVLRRGAVMVGEGELARRMLVARLARLVSLHRFTVAFQGGVSAYPPGSPHQLALATWVRAYLEDELTSALAENLAHELAGMRLSVRAALLPVPANDADCRMLRAMEKPRRLDQIWPLARTSRFRILAFLHFLRTVDALEAEGVVAEQARPSHRSVSPMRVAAARVFGLSPDASDDAIKRAYRRLARSLHPDLQPRADAARRRSLEQRFAEVTAAYEVLR